MRSYPYFKYLIGTLRQARSSSTDICPTNKRNPKTGMEGYNIFDGVSKSRENHHIIFQIQSKMTKNVSCFNFCLNFDPRVVLGILATLMVIGTIVDVWQQVI